MVYFWGGHFEWSLFTYLLHLARVGGGRGRFFASHLGSPFTGETVAILCLGFVGNPNGTATTNGCAIMDAFQQEIVWIKINQ